MVLIGLATTNLSAARWRMTANQARLLDLIAGIPTLRALGHASGQNDIAELSADHRRSAMATLRIAFLSALVLELLARWAWPSHGRLRATAGLQGEMSLTAGLTVLLLAPEVYWPLRWGSSFMR